MTEAIRRLEEAAGTQFDPALTPAFIRLAVTDAATVFETTDMTLATAV